MKNSLRVREDSPAMRGGVRLNSSGRIVLDLPPAGPVTPPLATPPKAPRRIKELPSRDQVVAPKEQAAPKGPPPGPARPEKPWEGPRILSDAQIARRGTRWISALMLVFLVLAGLWWLSMAKAAPDRSPIASKPIRLQVGEPPSSAPAALAPAAVPADTAAGKGARARNFLGLPPGEGNPGQHFHPRFDETARPAPDGSSGEELPADSQVMQW